MVAADTCTEAAAVVGTSEGVSGSSIAGDDATGRRRATLLERLAAATRGIEDLDQLEEAVELVEKLPEARLARQAAVIKQLTFYFSDANLGRDRYLRELIEEDESGQGYVPIAMLMPFNRLKTLGCSTAAELAAAVEAAPKASALELSPCRSRMRRASAATPPPPLAPDGGGSQQEARCVQITGFPVNDTSVTIEAVIELCAPFGVANFVRLLRDATAKPLASGDRPFLGEAEVEFAEEAGAAAASAARPPPEWKGLTLRVWPLAEYRAKQQARRADVSDEESSLDEAPAKRRRVEGGGGLESRLPRGVTLRIEGVPPELTWWNVRDAMTVYGQVAYVNRGHGEGEDTESSSGRWFVRMKDVDGAVAVVEAAAVSTDGLLPLHLGPGYQTSTASASVASAAPRRPREQQPAGPAARKDAAGPAPASGAAAVVGGEELDDDSWADGVLNARPSAPAPPATAVETAKLLETGGCDDSVSPCVAAAAAAATEVAAAASGAADLDDSWADETPVAGPAAEEAEPAEAAEEDGDEEDEGVVRLKVIRLAGEEEEAYLQKTALAIKAGGKASGKAGGKASKGWKGGGRGKKGGGKKGAK